MPQKKEFKFPITPLAGSRISVFLRLSLKYGIERPFFFKWLLSLFVSLICTVLGFFDVLRFGMMKRKSLDHDPVFIVGHWRSGTTFLHNLMCLDPKAAYTTTYQTVFPNNLFAFQWLFKPIMKSMMPSSRPVDNVKLHADFPQEEEFALNNEGIYSQYNWWYFPKKARAIVDEYLLGNASSSEQKSFEKNYLRFVQRCMHNTKGERFISKNPPHTARVAMLKRLFPKAKFIFIHRNPYEVVRSTFNFYRGILPGTQLQKINEEALVSYILYSYKEMMRIYDEQKKGLPEKDLLEIAYTDLVQDPPTCIQKIYDEFLGVNYLEVKDKVEAHVQSKHQLKDYQYDQDYINLINGSLKDIIIRQGYQLL